MKAAVVGSSGFVGQAAIQSLEEASIDAVAVRAPRLRYADIPLDEGFSIAPYEDIVDAIATDLHDADVLIIAGGLAAPDSADVEGLRGANALMPRLCYEAAVRSHADRVIHVSSAAVQGRRKALDDTWDVSPFSPYSSSKAEGEHALRSAYASSPSVELSIYRPTSVLGASRAVTKALARLNRFPVLPVKGKGDAPVPLALIENVGAAIAYLAACRAPPQLSTHPWEGMTCESMLRTFAPSARQLGVPKPLVSAVLQAARAIGGRSASVAGAVRRAELLLEGQEVRAVALEGSGFRLPIGLEGYAVLAQSLLNRTNV